MTFFQPNLTDKLTPIVVSMDYELFEDVREASRRRRGHLLSPIMRSRNGNKNTDFTLIQRNCGDDDICVPNLVLDTQM